MKRLILFVFFIFHIGSNVYSQNKTIDSLKSVLLTQKEDTSKVNTLLRVAIHYNRIDDFRNAEINANEAGLLAEKIGYKRGQMIAFYRAGLYSKDLESSLKYYRRSLQISRELKDANYVSYTTQIITLDSLKNISLTQKEDTNKVNVLLRISKEYNGFGQFKDSKQYAKEALALAKKIGNKRGQMIAAFRAGLNEDKEFLKATEDHLFSLQISYELNDSFYIAQNSEQLANIYAVSGKYPESLKYAYAALKIYEMQNDSFQKGNMYRAIGYTYFNQNIFSEALKYANLAKQMHELIDEQYRDASLSNDYSIIAEIYLGMGNLDLAYENILKRLESINKKGSKIDKSNLGGAYRIIGDIFMKKGDIDMVRKQLKSAEDNYNEAIKNYLESKMWFGKEFHGFNSKRIDVLIGIANFKLNKLYPADSLLRTGLKAIQEVSNFQEVKRDAYLYLFKIDSIEGNWEKAILNYRKYISLKDSLFNEEIAKKTTTYQMQYEFDLKEAATKAEQDKKELALQKEIELKALNYEYEKKQSAAKTEKEKQQLQYEQQLKQQQIEAQYAQKVAQIEAEQKRKTAIAKIEQEKRESLNASALALSQAEVRRKNQENTYFLLGLGLLTALLGFIVYGYFQKQKANTLLQVQKTEIDHKSQQLEKSLTELRSTQNQLIQKEKLASLGELTAGIAHEIQNPLNFVNNFSEMSVELAQELKDEIKKPEKDWELIEDLAEDLSQNQQKINQHGKRASSIVSGMLEHSRTITGERAMTDINKLADEYLRLSYHGMRAKYKDFNSDYEFIADENLPLINLVPQDMGRVLLNLINNAFYAVSQPNQQGFKNLTALNDAKIIVKTEHSDNQLIIKVIDNGTGMSKEVQAKIFQPFFTTKPTGEGTGLGLSLSYDIITKGHGGTIEVESVEGEGTRFVVKLPIT